MALCRAVCGSFVCMYVYNASSAGSGYSKRDGCTFSVCSLLSTIVMLLRSLGLVFPRERVLNYFQQRAQASSNETLRPHLFNCTLSPSPFGHFLISMSVCTCSCARAMSLNACMCVCFAMCVTRLWIYIYAVYTHTKIVIYLGIVLCALDHGVSLSLCANIESSIHSHTHTKKFSPAVAPRVVCLLNILTLTHTHTHCVSLCYHVFAFRITHNSYYTLVCERGAVAVCML